MESTGAWSSDELPRLDLKVVHHDIIHSYVHQSDLLY